MIFDEFHERNLQGDIGLALALQAQELLRNDLRLLVMSATLDGTAVSTLLGDAPVVVPPSLGGTIGGGATLACDSRHREQRCRPIQPAYAAITPPAGPHVQPAKLKWPV